MNSKFYFYYVITCMSMLQLQAQGSAETGNEMPEYQEMSLEYHNHYRSMHQVGPLRINATLYQMALSCAQYYASIGRVDHTCPNKHVPWGAWNWNVQAGQAGENLWGMNLPPRFQPLSPDEVVLSTMKMWYKDEKVNHNFQSPFYQPGSGHFSQMVWKETREFGFAIFTANQFSAGVALYYIPGNMDGDFLNNVFPEITEERVM